MICLDNSVLGDLLDGKRAAKEFMQPYDEEEWVIPSIVLYEAYLGALLNLPRGTPEDVRNATSGVDVLPLDERAVYLATDLQRDLRADGRQLGKIDALVGTVAVQSGATLATGDGHLADALADCIDIARYDPP